MSSALILNSRLRYVFQFHAHWYSSIDWSIDWSIRSLICLFVCLLAFISWLANWLIWLSEIVLFYFVFSSIYHRLKPVLEKGKEMIHMTMKKSNSFVKSWHLNRRFRLWPMKLCELLNIYQSNIKSNPIWWNCVNCRIFINQTSRIIRSDVNAI